MGDWRRALEPAVAPRNGLIYRHKRKVIWRDGREYRDTHPIIARVCNKWRLAQVLEQMGRQDVQPPSLLLHDKQQLQQVVQSWAEGQSAVWILKPICSSCGQGISVVDAATAAATTTATQASYLAQRYIERPLLILGRKFDVRAYLMVFEGQLYYRLGWARLNIERYVRGDFANRLVHLTNINVQKTHPRFRPGRSRLFYPDLVRHLGQKNLDQIEAQVIGYLRDLGQHLLPQSDNTGQFALLGVDYMVDETGKPWLLEINWRPSLCKRDRNTQRHRTDRGFLQDIYMTLCHGKQLVPRIL
eukprot:g1076.t1